MSDPRPEVLPNVEWLYSRCQRIGFTTETQMAMYVPFTQRHDHKERQRILGTMRQHVLEHGISIMSDNDLLATVPLQEQRVWKREQQQRYCFHMIMYRNIIKGFDSIAKVAQAFGLEESTVAAYVQDIKGQEPILQKAVSASPALPEETEPGSEPCGDVRNGVLLLLFAVLAPLANPK